MIFVTTGTQAPFNRLVKAMDAIADDLNGEEIVVQAFGVDFVTRNLKIIGFMPPLEYNKIFEEARLIVSHAGMGSILSALNIGKPIIVIPRKEALHEHRNDHQTDTARKMESLGYIPVAYDEQELRIKIIEMLSDEKKSAAGQIGNFASDSLIKSVRDFILNA